MPIIKFILHVDFFLFLCTKRLGLSCSKLVTASLCAVLLLFFFSLLWFCHSEVHLSEEKPAALVELAVAFPVGDRLCSDVDVNAPQAQSDSPQQLLFKKNFGGDQSTDNPAQKKGKTSAVRV